MLIQARSSLWWKRSPWFVIGLLAWAYAVFHTYFFEPYGVSSVVMGWLLKGATCFLPLLGICSGFTFDPQTKQLERWWGWLAPLYWQKVELKGQLLLVPRVLRFQGFHDVATLSLRRGEKSRVLFATNDRKRSVEVAEALAAQAGLALTDLVSGDAADSRVRG